MLGDDKEVDMDIVYENNKFIIINKPAGKLTQGNRSFDVDLTSEVMTYRRKKGEPPYAAVINRLDRPVSGLVLFAKDKQEAARLTRLMQGEGFQKQYYAIICGKPDSSKGTFVDYLLKDGKTNLSSVTDKTVSGSKLAKLEYEVVETISTRLDETVSEVSEFSLVRIHLLTGRHHQIRVQFSSRKLPLLGDVKYNGLAIEHMKMRDFADQKIQAVGRNEIALCAYALSVDGKTYEIKPAWFC